MEFFAQRFGGDIVSRVEINDTVATLLSGRAGDQPVSILMVGFFAALMFQYDAVLTLLGDRRRPAQPARAAAARAPPADASLRLLQERGKLVGASMAGLQSIETLKASGTESEFFSTWAGHQAKVVTSEKRTRGRGAVPVGRSALADGVNAAVVIGLGGLRSWTAC